MTVSSSTPPWPPSHRTALLVDLENLAYTADGELISDTAFGARLDEVLALAGPVHYRLGAAQRHMLRRYGAELAARNLRWQECTSGPDEADRVLTEAGLGLLLRGFGCIVVASGDHFFARLGELCDLRVAVPRGVGVSPRLASAGTVLTAARGTVIHTTSAVDASATRPDVSVPAAA